MASSSTSTRNNGGNNVLQIYLSRGEWCWVCAEAEVCPETYGESYRGWRKNEEIPRSKEKRKKQKIEREVKT